jgi:hypothetical protein
LLEGSQQPALPEGGKAAAIGPSVETTSGLQLRAARVEEDLRLTDRRPLAGEGDQDRNQGLAPAEEDLAAVGDRDPIDGSHDPLTVGALER